MSAALSRLLTLREQLLLAAFAVAILIGAAALYYAGKDERDLPGDALVLAPEDSAPPHAAPAKAPPIPTPRTPPVELPAPADAYLATADAPPIDEEIGVAIRGEVVRPGFYYFKTGDRVFDLIETAGGFTEKADETDINVGAHLIDGTTLTIPALPSPAFDGHALRVRGQQPPAVNNPAEYTISGWRNSGQAERGRGAVNASLSAHGRAVVPDERINLNTATQSELESLPGIGPAYAARIISYREQQPFERIEDLMNISGIAEKRFAALEDLVRVD